MLVLGSRGGSRPCAWYFIEERDDLLCAFDQDIAHGARWETRVLHKCRAYPRAARLSTHFQLRLLALTILLGVKLRTNDEFGAVING